MPFKSYEQQKAVMAIYRLNNPKGGRVTSIGGVNRLTEEQIKQLRVALRAAASGQHRAHPYNKESEVYPGSGLGKSVTWTPAESAYLYMHMEGLTKHEREIKAMAREFMVQQFGSDRKKWPKSRIEGRKITKVSLSDAFK